MLNFAVSVGLAIAMAFLAEVAPAQSTDDPVASLIERIDSGQCRPDFEHNGDGLHPIDLPAIERLQRAVNQYVQLVSAGGWPVIADGLTIHPGARDVRVSAVRQRLRTSGDLRHPLAVPKPDLMDFDLTEAVKRFQLRHGLTPDGKIGRQTRNTMNVPARARLTQLRTNLKRLKRLYREDRAYRYVMVNIPDFSLAAIQDQTVALTSRVVVGRTDRQTPQFNTSIKAVTFHPTWKVPASIVRRDLYPRFKTDPGYFARGDFLLSGATDGLLIDPEVLPAQPLTPAMIRVQQLPGPTNALGAIRLEMPNKHAVFLHDTSSPELYNNENRSASSGCIRVQKIIELAQWLLVEQPGWSRAQIDSVLTDQATLTVLLPEPVPVYLAYITAWVPKNEHAPQFRPDLYQLDSLPATTGP